MQKRINKPFPWNPLFLIWLNSHEVEIWKLDICRAMRKWEPAPPEMKWSRNGIDDDLMNRIGWWYDCSWLFCRPLFFFARDLVSLLICVYPITDWSLSRFAIKVAKHRFVTWSPFKIWPNVPSRNESGRHARSASRALYNQLEPTTRAHVSLPRIITHS